MCVDLAFDVVARRDLAGILRDNPDAFTSSGRKDTFGRFLLVTARVHDEREDEGGRVEEAEADPEQHALR